MIQPTRTLSDKFFLFIKGLAMGAANKVPGVSGGVVAFVAGFYEEFIYSFQKVNLKALKLLLNGRFKSFYNYINGRFLSLLLAGMVVSFFSVSKILDYFIQQKELYVWAAFFGMILGSIYYIAKDFEYWNKKIVLFCIIGIAVGASLSYLNPAKENDNLLFVFFCGFISVSGMTLPGLSGSFILILIGNYVLLLVDSVNALYDTFANLIQWNLEPIQSPDRIRLLTILAAFSLGSVVGLVSLSHILSYVLKNYKNRTTAIILGFIIGSLGVVWPWKQNIYKYDLSGQVMLDSTGEKVIANYQRYLPSFTSYETWIAIGFVIFGIAIVLWLEWYGHKTRKNE